MVRSLMFKRKTTIDPEIFSALPVREIRVGSGGQRLAVHVHGELTEDRLPVVVLPGYSRNMLDFEGLAAGVNGASKPSLAFILIDLPGRGRSSVLPKSQPYSTPYDSQMVLEVLDALDVPRAVFVGEGHGGQVTMLVSQARPSIIGASVLIDSGPVIDSRGLVRMRNNHKFLMSQRGERAIAAAMGRIMAADYPGETASRLQELGMRNYALSANGRLMPLFDPRILAQLDAFEFDDALEPQWPLFDALNYAPLMMVRTQLSDQLHRATFEEMQRRRPDAATLTISGQGSPALFDGAEEVQALASFLSDVCRKPKREALAAV